MPRRRVEHITAIITKLGHNVWRETRYANDTGTALWVSNQSLVMVPDDQATQPFCQGKAGDEMAALLEAEHAFEVPANTDAPPELLESMALDNLKSLPAGAAALLRAAETLAAEAHAAALGRMRQLILRQMTARYGSVPAPVRLRVEQATADQLESWGVALLGARTALDAISGPT